MHGIFVVADNYKNYRCAGKTRVFSLNEKNTVLHEYSNGNDQDYADVTKEGDLLEMFYQYYVVSRSGTLKLRWESTVRTVSFPLQKHLLHQGFFTIFQGKPLKTKFIGFVPPTMAFGDQWISAGKDQIEANSTAAIVYCITSKSDSHDKNLKVPPKFTRLSNVLDLGIQGFEAIFDSLVE